MFDRLSLLVVDDSPFAAKVLMEVFRALHIDRITKAMGGTEADTPLTIISAAQPIAATVIAVPSPITRVAAMPAQNMPCASANTRTRIAPEHGRRPTATIAASPRCQPPGPASSVGSGACACPHAEA